MAGNKYDCAILADRSCMASDGVRGLLEAVFSTVVVVTNLSSLLDSAVRLQPELAAVDLSLAQSGDLLWIAELRAQCPDTKVIALSVHNEAMVSTAAREAGCAGVVVKSALATELLPVIERVLPGLPGSNRSTPDEDE